MSMSNFKGSMQFRGSTLVYHFVTCNLFDQTARFYRVLIRDPSLIWNAEKLEVRQRVSKNVPVCDVQYINFFSWQAERQRQ